MSIAGGRTVRRPGRRAVLAPAAAPGAARALAAAGTGNGLPPHPPLQHRDGGAGV